MAANDMRRPLVLIVEDNAANQLLIQVTLERGGLATHVTASAAEALDFLRSCRAEDIDAILMDVQLPGMDGLELTRQLKGDPASADVPIIAVTARAMKDDEARARAAGCDGYISKPINTRSLVAQITEVVARTSRSRRA